MLHGYVILVEAPLHKHYAATLCVCIFLTYLKLWIWDTQCKCSQENEKGHVKTQINEEEKGHVVKPFPPQKAENHWMKQ